MVPASTRPANPPTALVPVTLPKAPLELIVPATLRPTKPPVDA